jgi:hypothetical protein
MSLDISLQIFYRLSNRSAAMLCVGSRFLTAQRIAQATVSSPVSVSSSHGSADCALFQQPNPNLVYRSPFMSSFFWFHCVVHSFFLLYLFHIVLPLFYPYFFNFILSHFLSFVLFLFIFSSRLCLFSVFSTVRAVSLRLSVSANTSVQTATLFLCIRHDQYSTSDQNTA